MIALASSARAADPKKPQGAGQRPATPAAPPKKTAPLAETILKRATAHEKEGKIATAWAEYKQVIEEATKSNDGKRLETARAHLADTFKKLSYVKIEAGQSNATEVLVDGKLVDKSAWSTPQPFDPGPHEVKVAATGSRTETLTITLPPGPATQSLTLPTLQPNGDAPPAIAAAPPAAEPTKPEPKPEAKQDTHSEEADLLREGPSGTEPYSAPKKSGGNTGRTVGFVLGGVGIVGIGLGSYFGVVALGNKKTVDAHCAAGASDSLTSNAIPCDAQGFSAQKDAHTNGTISTIGLGVGAAALATGIVLVLVSKGPEKKAALHVTPSVPVVGAGGGLQVGGAF